MGCLLYTAEVISSTLAVGVAETVMKAARLAVYEEMKTSIKKPSTTCRAAARSNSARASEGEGGGDKQ